MMRFIELGVDLGLLDDDSGERPAVVLCERLYDLVPVRLFVFCRMERLNVVTSLQQGEAQRGQASRERRGVVGPGRREDVEAAAARREVEAARLIEVDVK
jgi:hypothetical protein